MFKKLADPHTWCVRCGLSVAITWTVLVICSASITLYIEYLESKVATLEHLDKLSTMHFGGVLASHISLWLVGMFCTIGCIILMRESADELDQERLLSQRYFDVAAVIMVVLDDEGRIKHLNNRGHEILERTGENLKGRFWIELCIPEDDQLNVRTTFDHLMNGEIVEYYENHIITKHGKRRLIAWRNTILYEGNVAVGTLSSGLDITEQRQVSDELQRSCDDLAQKNAELARFVYTASHDLKSPLVTIKGYIGLMLDNVRNSKYGEAQKNAITINRAADKMQQLLDELLTLSRIGRVVGDYTEKSLGEVVASVLDGLNGICEDASIEVQDDMPTIYGDQTRIGELLQNLLENAIKYTGEGDVPQVRITAWVEDNETVCCVEDNGIGIEQAYLDRIFNLFEKLDPDSPGSGVGLAVAKRIIEVHHGRIWCESNGPGTGAKFYFALPRPEG